MHSDKRYEHLQIMRSKDEMKEPWSAEAWILIVWLGGVGTYLMSGWLGIF